MEITREEAQKMLAMRLDQYPETKALVNSPSFKNNLAQIAEFFQVDSALLPIIENEVLVVLCFYAPLTELAQNISESTGLPVNLCENIATMLNALVFSPVHDDLAAFELLWEEELKKTTTVPDANSDLKERLDLRPQNASAPWGASQPPKPLTREELMSALAPKRTMTSDIEAMRAKTGGASIVEPPPPPASPSPQ